MKWSYIYLISLCWEILFQWCGAHFTNTFLQYICTQYIQMHKMYEQIYALLCVCEWDYSKPYQAIYLFWAKNKITKTYLYNYCGWYLFISLIATYSFHLFICILIQENSLYTKCFLRCIWIIFSSFFHTSFNLVDFYGEELSTVHCQCFEGVFWNVFIAELRN